MILTSAPFNFRTQMNLKTTVFALVAASAVACLAAPGLPRQASKTVGTDEIVAALKDDDVLIRIGERDSLKWGLFRKVLDAQETESEIADGQPSVKDGQPLIKQATYRARFRKLLKEYVQHGVIAEAARKAGMTVPDEVYEEYRAKARERYSQMGAVGQRLRKLMDEPESFYEHNLTNSLLWLEYRNKVIEPKVGVEDEAVAKLVESRRTGNDNRMKENFEKRDLMREIKEKLAGGMDFADAARKWSECDSAESGGVLMDDEDDEKVAVVGPDDLHPAVAAACARLKEGETSDVIETPYTWHIMKVLKRHPPAEEGAPETMELAHIMLEKEILQPELDAEQAREIIRKKTLRSAVDAEFAELYPQTDIECKIPIMDENGKKSRTSVEKLK